jgi:hypothetical protein
MERSTVVQRSGARAKLSEDEKIEPEWGIFAALIALSATLRPSSY